MPVYDFKCPEYKKEAENTVSQPGGSGGFTLKGTGWYATDFKGK